MVAQTEEEGAEEEATEREEEEEEEEGGEGEEGVLLLGSLGGRSGCGTRTRAWVPRKIGRKMRCVYVYLSI